MRKFQDYTLNKILDEGCSENSMFNEERVCFKANVLRTGFHMIVESGFFRALIIETSENGKNGLMDWSNMGLLSVF